MRIIRENSKTTRQISITFKWYHITSISFRVKKESSKSVDAVNIYEVVNIVLVNEKRQFESK